MPRVLFVSYSGLAGGAERVLLDCAEALGDSAVVVVCPPGPLASGARGRGLPVLELPVRSLALRGGGRTRVAAAAVLADHAWRIRRACAGLDPDLVVAWGMRSAIGWGIGAARWPGVVAHNDFLPGPLIGRLVRWCAHRAQLVVVPSQAVADDLGAVARVAVVAPGVDVDAYGRGGDPAEPPEVLVLGALAAWKRPDLALDIAARARRRLPGLRVRLVGAPVVDDGELLAALERRAAQPDLAGAAELAGASADPRPDLARASCLLHCAPREPFGLVLVEAMASGRPVVAPDAAGPREIVAPGCGRLYPPGDAEAGAAALVELMASPEDRRRAGAAGRELVRRRFRRERTQAEFRDAVAPALRGRGGWVWEPAPSDVLTLVTVTHNSADDVRVLLRSVARCLPGVRVIVVDSGSRDDSVAVAREWPGVASLALGENVGFGRACNRGLGLVGTPVTALVNPDVELIDDSLLGLAAEAMRCDRLLAPRVLNGDGTIQDTVHPRPGSVADAVRSVVPPAAVPGRLGVPLAPWRARTPRRVGWAVGCALVARTATLRALGPFDEAMFLYGEDLELGLRASGHGVSTWLWPDARVIHRRAHASTRVFGGEPFQRLAAARRDAVRRARGPAWTAVDDAAQAVTFASRGALKRALGRPATRERRQLAALRAVRATDRPRG